MNRYVLTILVALLLFGSFETNSVLARSSRTSSSDIYVSGYFRKDGTYVKPYYRTPADSHKWNNYVCIDYGRCGGEYDDRITYTDNDICQQTYGINAIASSINGNCICKVGYERNSNGNACIKTKSLSEICQETYGIGATVSVDNYSCECKKGYSWDENMSMCIEEDFTTNFCKDKYGVGSRGDGVVNSDGTFYCYCKTGYTWSEDNTYCISYDNIISIEDCTLTYGPNATISDDGESCKCNNGYYLNSTNTLCIQNRVILNGVNFRTSPSIEAEIIQVIDQSNTVSIIGSRLIDTKLWYNIEFYGIRGRISAIAFEL